ncbi:AMP-binding protein [Sneathiella chinensis]|uniref:Fatty-acid-CoA ligase FadD n=1 Tax=Sneathiella chinensis TaxID=349750 RepID=A0ABQ5U645_9PROT|nr:AMP-binding protein [Sneathiella chinensis]GLQ06777.1 putative fatty-acid-CoA ligase FadD [Sneathiella chinensis]
MQNEILTKGAGGEALYTDVTYASLYVKALSRRPNNIAFVWDGQQMTYRQLRDHISQSVQVLSDLGLERGDTVACLCRNSPFAIVLWASCAVLGLRYTPLNPLGSVETDDFIIQKAKVRAVLVDTDSFAERARGAAERDNPVDFVLALNGGDIGLDFKALCSAKTARQLKVEANPEDVIAIFFTGGTTGEPKGVMHTSRSLVANAMISSCEWEWPAKIDILLATPVSHAAGYMVLPVLLRGGTVHLHDGFSPERFLKAVAAKEINTSFMVPTMIYTVLDTPGVEEVDFSHLEMVAYGAAPISIPRLHQAIDLFGPVLMQGYGQTEAPNSVMTLYPSCHEGERFRSCGMPLAGITVKILDESLQEVPAGEVGEICIRGPLVMEGYLDNPEETARALQGGWLHTGDVGYQDEDGFVYLIDRLKDLIISGGFNVYPKEIEDIVAGHPAVADVAVVGVPDDKWGEAVVAAVVLYAGQSVPEQVLIDAVREDKGTVYAPKKIVFMEEGLPKTALGKPDKKELRRLLSQ